MEAAMIKCVVGLNFHYFLTLFWAGGEEREKRRSDLFSAIGQK